MPGYETSSAFDPGPACEYCPNEPIANRNEPWLKRKSTTLMGTYLAGDDDKLGISDFFISSSFQVSRLPMLTISPTYQMSFLTGPETTDLPSTLYRTGVDIAWTQPLSQQWMLQVAVTPGVAADFHTNSSEMVRVMGRVLAFYQASEDLKWVFGAVYLARDDLPVLPAIGVIYTPTPDLKLDLTFPRPRLYYRYQEFPGRENWWYIGGEIGGGSYAIERNLDGTTFTDVVSIGELKGLMGFEFRLGDDPKNMDILFYEIGVAFNRDVEYESGYGDYSPDSTLYLRAGLTF